MKYAIFENGIQVNTIIADEEFCHAYCEENNYTYEEIIEEQPVTQEEEINLEHRYELRVVELIRQRYTDSEEFKILREYLADKNETTEKAFTDYNNYVIECKAQAKKEILGE